jgi:DNA invertase Pin-like site-specific DNA recombinase
MKQYVTYLRVSTQRQGAQGLGISAQRNMCENFIKQNNGCHVQEFMDVESGTHRDRKGLWQAIDYCKKNDCSLVIAKLDRMSRDVEFTFKVINTGIDIHFTDMPVVNSMILGVFAAVAQYEREMVSTRTKQALAVKKKQGCKLGAANEKWQETYNNKSKEQKEKEQMRKGETKRQRYHDNIDTKTFLRVLKMVQPEHCAADDPKDWEWVGIDTKCGRREQMLTLMRNFKENDEEGRIFRNWDFTDIGSKKNRDGLCAYIQRIRKSFLI